MMTTSVDTILEDNFLKQVTNKVNERFTDAEIVVEATLLDAEKDAALKTLGDLKARLVAVEYETGIEAFKRRAVSQLSGRGW